MTPYRTRMTRRRYCSYRSALALVDTFDALADEERATIRDCAEGRLLSRESESARMLSAWAECQLLLCDLAERGSIAPLERAVLEQYLWECADESVSDSRTRSRAN